MYGPKTIFLSCQLLLLLSVDNANALVVAVFTLMLSLLVLLYHYCTTHCRV